MAPLIVWLAAAVALLPALAVPVWVALHGETGDRLAASQLASVLTVLLLAALSFAFRQPSFIDLALALGLLSLPGGLLFAVTLGRWL